VDKYGLKSKVLLRFVRFNEFTFRIENLSRPIAERLRKDKSHEIFNQFNLK